MKWKILTPRDKPQNQRAESQDYPLRRLGLGMRSKLNIVSGKTLPGGGIACKPRCLFVIGLSTYKLLKPRFGNTRHGRRNPSSELQHPTYSECPCWLLDRAKLG